MGQRLHSRKTGLVVFNIICLLIRWLKEKTIAFPVPYPGAKKIYLTAE
jgi:hypothetical protein